MASVVYYQSEAQTSSLPSIQQTLHKLNARQLPTRWNLEHRLYRSVPPSSADTAKITPPRLLHILTSNQHGAKSWSLGTASGDGTQGQGALVAIPLQQKDELARLLNTKFSALWLTRSQLAVLNGAIFEFGEFLIRVGELKTAGANPQARGVVVWISEVAEQDLPASRTDDGDTIMADVTSAVNGDDKKEQEEVSSESLQCLREVWENFGIKGAKETTSKAAKGQENVTEAEVRMWCEVLRLRN